MDAKVPLLASSWNGNRPRELWRGRSSQDCSRTEVDTQMPAGEALMPVIEYYYGGVVFAMAHVLHEKCREGSVWASEFGRSIPPLELGQRHSRSIGGRIWYLASKRIKDRP